MKVSMIPQKSRAIKPIKSPWKYVGENDLRLLQSLFIGIVCYQRSPRITSIRCGECHVSVHIYQLQRRSNHRFDPTSIEWRWWGYREKTTRLFFQSWKGRRFHVALFFQQSLFQEYTFSITDNFISTCLESAISIEVWYHYSSIPLSINTTINNERNRRDAEIRALSNRWKEVKRHIQYAVEIHELDAAGRWEPVEVDAQQPQIVSGGIFRLRQVTNRSISLTVIYAFIT